ncbi:MAG TPA: radical SAM protein [Bacteroidia bacterium]|jgi:anaerobic magnesium-protoporphyrin IX monomethyl ester cyclase|nr:radical SAM protein [Bacteroidia bacterium]
MKILLTHSYFLKLDIKQYQAQTPYPPLATLYAAAFLRKNNFDVSFFDTQFCNSGKDIVEVLKKIKPNLFVICDDSFNYLSKMCLTNMRDAAFEMQRIAKQNGCKVVVSSSDAADNYEKYLNEEGADFVISGETEQTLLELACYLEKDNKQFDEIKGLIYKKNNTTIKTTSRPLMKDLDQLPYPAWDLVDISSYKKIWQKKHGYFSINLVTTRGCPFKCNWCAKPVYGNRYNSHSPGYIVGLIEYLQQKFEFDHIWFADDIFGLKPGWLKEFADLMKKNQIEISYKIQSRADLLLEEENIKYLSQSGCETVWMGAESGSEKILDAMDKGITVEQIYDAVEKLKQQKIKPSLFLQFGYPGETMEDISLTIKMVNKLVPEDIGISVSYPLPGTKFYEKVKNELDQKANWKDSDDLDLMFKNTFSHLFYKQLHRYIHKSYRGRQSLNVFKNFILFSNKDHVSLKRLFGFPFYFAGAYREKLKLKKLGPKLPDNFFKLNPLEPEIKI